MKKYLIINADDFGMCMSANEAVESLFLNGRLRSATIMMPCEASTAAIGFALAHPEFSIGVHLTMTSEWDTYKWRPLTDGRSLVDESGFMWKTAKQVEKTQSLKSCEPKFALRLTGRSRSDSSRRTLIIIWARSTEIRRGGFRCS